MGPGFPAQGAQGQVLTGVILDCLQKTNMSKALPVNVYIDVEKLEKTPLVDHVPKTS